MSFLYYDLNQVFIMHNNMLCKVFNGNVSYLSYHLNLLFRLL